MVASRGSRRRIYLCWRTAARCPGGSSTPVASRSSHVGGPVWTARRCLPGRGQAVPRGRRQMLSFVTGQTGTGIRPWLRQRWAASQVASARPASDCDQGRRAAAGTSARTWGRTLMPCARPTRRLAATRERVHVRLGVPVEMPPADRLRLADHRRVVWEGKHDFRILAFASDAGAIGAMPSAPLLR